MKSEEKRMFSQANTSLCNIITHSKYFSISDWLQSRAVKKFSSSRLIVNSRRLWNSHQRRKLLSAEASRDILKVFRVSEMPFPGVSKRYFNCGCHYCFVKIHREYTQDWEQCHRNVPGISRHRTVRAFHRSKPV